MILLVDNKEYDFKKSKDCDDCEKLNATYQLIFNGELYLGVEVEKEQPKKEYEILKMVDGCNWVHSPNEDGKKCNQYDNNCKIHSVKRLSDNSIWTVGDEVIGLVEGKPSWIIEGFETRRDDDLFIMRKYPDGLHRQCRLKHLRKPPTVLFTTEDGVEITNKEQVVFSVCPKAQWQTFSIIPAGRIASHNGWQAWKHFSTKEKRDEYILMNKPLLSVMDVIESFDLHNNIEPDDLKKLAKQKLNIQP